ncbi:LANO_0D01508g1_1 [Lachancea nothofagi CBS 11611]|uniref:LANO_0D01508g1_1 n=1 Tax=Lachancea nothofagi CBS 11611 TaxID=1266666 RepID=A0A1G4JE36_9SACH|nr:LANO_0D01508g1_1 [Lachancea nothofagi CBS 11611]
MDAYALKKDNRKKFQDKEKLKRKHATPSDRKYRSLNKAAEPEPEVPELQANDYRYHEDLTMTYQQDDFNAEKANQKLKQVLQSRGKEETSEAKGPVTRKHLDSMTVAELNGLLGRKNSKATQIEEPDLHESPPSRAPMKESRQKPGQSKSRSTVPLELESEQDLLDELI